MVRGILFDFWGTLVENGVFPSPTKQVKYILKNKDPFHTYVVKFEEAFMLQKFDDLFGGFKNVAKAFNEELPQHRLEKLVAVWNKNKLLAKPFPETIETLKNLKKTYKLALVANSDCFSVPEVLEKFELTKIFDTVKLSYEEGYLKSNPELFKAVLKDLKLKKNEVVMVGDSIESDIEGAKQAGINGILIDRKNRRDFKEKITDLSELEKYLK